MELFLALVHQFKAAADAAGLRFAYDALYWLWGLDLHLWYVPYTVLLAIELLIGRPERSSWRVVGQNYVFVTIWAVLFGLINPLVIDTVNWINARTGGPFIDLTFFMGDGFLRNFASVLLYYFIFDAFYYWWHRLQHEHPSLWVTHKMHHADEKMGVTATMKAHPTDLIGRTILVALPMGILFKLETTTIFWIGYSARLFQHFVHMNINCHLGWLNYIIASPNQHRIHHSSLPEHRDKNLAAFFSIFDVIFGTYCHPGKVAPPTGIDTGETYETIAQTYFRPFGDWWRMLTRRTMPVQS